MVTELVSEGVKLKTSRIKETNNNLCVHKEILQWMLKNGLVIEWGGSSV